MTDKDREIRILSIMGHVLAGHAPAVLIGGIVTMDEGQCKKMIRAAIVEGIHLEIASSIEVASLKGRMRNADV